MNCRQNTGTLRLCLIDHDTIGFFHCCFKYEICNTLKIDEFYKMSKEEFKIFLDETYKIIPENHDYSILPHCFTDEPKCLYNDKYITNIAIDVFSYCNIKCKFCLLTDNKQPQTPLENKKIYFDILEKLKGNHYETIITTGVGEPFFYKKETIDYIKTLTLNDCENLLIITNTTLLDPEDIIELGKIKEKTKINIHIIASCSAISNFTYYKVHNNNKFNKVVENIRLMNENNLLDFVNFVAQEDNLHEISSFKEFWHKQGILDDKKLLISPVHGEKNKNILDSTEYINYKKNENCTSLS